MTLILSPLVQRFLLGLFSCTEFLSSVVLLLKGFFFLFSFESLSNPNLLKTPGYAQAFFLKCPYLFKNHFNVYMTVIRA